MSLRHIVIIVVFLMGISTTSLGFMGQLFEENKDATNQYIAMTVSTEIEIYYSQKIYEDKGRTFDSGEKISESEFGQILPRSVEGIIESTRGTGKFRNPGDIGVTISGTFDDYCVTSTSEGGKESLAGSSYSSSEGRIPTEQSTSQNCSATDGDITVGDIMEKVVVVEDSRLPIPLMSIIGITILTFATITSVFGLLFIRILKKG